MEFLRLENQQLKERHRLLLLAQERAKASIAEYIYYNNLEQEETINKIKFLKEQIAQLTEEVNSFKKKEIPGETSPSEEVIQYDEGGDIKCAMLEKLVELLYSTQEGTDYVNVFLLTYRAYTNTAELLENLLNGYTKLTNDASPDSTKGRLRIGIFLKKWITENFHDFAEPALLDRYYEFTNVIAKTDAKLGASLTLAFDHKTKGIQKRYSSVMFSEAPPTPLIPKQGSILTSIVEISPLEIARQLTLMDYTLCRAIEPKECLGCAWTKHDKETRSPNLLAMIKRFNKVSKWISAIIVKEPVLKKRVKVLSHILSVVQHLRELNNFNAVFQIIGGLGNSSVHRITKTFQQIDKTQKKVLEDLKILTNPLKSWANYRKTIHEVNPPCVPFIGVYQTDLTFIEDGNPTRFANGMINFKKCRLVAGVILEIQQYQQKPYNLSSNQQIHDFLSQSIEEVQSLDDKALYELSLVAEPRVTAVK